MMEKYMGKIRGTFSSIDYLAAVYLGSVGDGEEVREEVGGDGRVGGGGVALEGGKRKHWDHS